MKSIKNVYGLALLAIIIIFAVAAPAFADDTNPLQIPNFQRPDGNGGMMQRSNKGMMRFNVSGTVTAINGNIITVSSVRGFGSAAVTTTFTVDATNAKIIKGNIAGTIASIVVGDNIMVQGPITGTNIVASIIRDRVIQNKGEGDQGGKVKNENNKRPALIGNGEPVVAGTVTAINGSTVTITNGSNVTYTVDVSNAKITQDQNAITSSNISIGDTLIVQGTVNGNAVTAATVFDHPKPANTTGEGDQGQSDKGGGGFFSGIGSFFSHLFGF